MYIYRHIYPLQYIALFLQTRYARYRGRSKTKEQRRAGKNRGELERRVIGRQRHYLRITERFATSDIDPLHSFAASKLTGMVR